MKVIFNEPLHHVCLMYGLKAAFEKMPSMNRRILNIGGKTVTIDNIASTPPMIKNPQRASVSGSRKSRNIVEVSYWKDSLSIEYKEDMCSREDITAFAEYLIQAYLHFRHPYTRFDITDNKCREIGGTHTIAEII